MINMGKVSFSLITPVKMENGVFTKQNILDPDSRSKTLNKYKQIDMHLKKKNCKFSQNLN